MAACYRLYNGGSDYAIQGLFRVDGLRFTSPKVVTLT